MTTDKKLIILAVTVLVLIGVVDALGQYGETSRSPSNVPNEWTDRTVCPMDVRECSDGSYVGRTGPRCEFALCPAATSTAATSTGTTTRPGGTLLTGSLIGRVMLGPTCPVMRNPPDPDCADRPYVTTVVVTVSGTGKEVGRHTTDANGNFIFAFLPGKYDVKAIGGTTLPSCSTTTVTLTKGETTRADISCDTGIR